MLHLYSWVCVKSKQLGLDTRSHLISCDARTTVLHYPWYLRDRLTKREGENRRLELVAYQLRSTTQRVGRFVLRGDKKMTNDNLNKLLVFCVLFCAQKTSIVHGAQALETKGRTHFPK